MGSGLVAVSTLLLLSALAGCLGGLQDDESGSSGPHEPSPAALPESQEPSAQDLPVEEEASENDEPQVGSTGNPEPTTSDRFYLVRHSMITLENRHAEEPTQVPFSMVSPLSHTPIVVRTEPWVYHFQGEHEITGVEATLWMRVSNPVVLASNEQHQENPRNPEGCGFMVSIAIGNQVDGNRIYDHCSDQGDGILYPGDQRIHLEFPPLELSVGSRDQMTIRLFAEFSSETGDDLVVLGGSDAFDSHVRLHGADEVVGYPTAGNGEAAAEETQPVQPDPGPGPERTAPSDGSASPMPHSTDPETGEFTMGILVVTSLLAALGRFVFKIGRYRILQWFFAYFLFTRLTKETALEHKRRATLFDMVRETPGITFSGLRKRSELGSGTLLHHLRVLEKQGLVRCVRDGLRSRFYVHGAAIDGGPYLNQVQRSLVKAIRRYPGSTQKQLSSILGLPRQSLHYHSKRMEAIGKIRIRRDGRSRRHYPA